MISNNAALYNCIFHGISHTIQHNIGNYTYFSYSNAHLLFLQLSIISSSRTYVKPSHSSTRT